MISALNVGGRTHTTYAHYYNSSVRYVPPKSRKYYYCRHDGLLKIYNNRHLCDTDKSFGSITKIGRL